jgi:hypothetical protein
MTEETPSGPANTLLEVDGHDDCEEEACMALSGVDDPDGVDVVFVTFTKSADQRLAAWRDHANAPPANIGIVSVEMGGANGGGSPDRPGGPAVRRISDPSDLTGVGIAISEFLSVWDDTDQQTVVCFDSVTALLQYVDANRVFQFLNEMTSKFEQAGVHAHFHLLPEAHEAQDLSVLTSLFGDRKTAASVVDDDGAEATADADEGDASEADAGGFVFGDGTDDADEFVFGDETDGTDDADADTPEPDEEADDADETDESPLIETNENEDATDGDDDPVVADLGSTGSSLLDDDDGDETAADDDTTPTSDDTAGAPQDRVERSVEKVEGAEQSDSEGSPVVGPPVGAGPKRKTGAEMGAKQPNDRSDAATSTAATATTATTATANGPTTSSASGTTDDEDSDKYSTAFYSRTTATVVGVVVMLVLISFLAAAMPIPMGDETAANATESPITTATPEPTASSATSGTTATETPSPTPTATPSPTATPTPTPDSSTSGSTDSSDSTSTATPTATPTPTPAPTDTPTPTPEGDLTDTVDDTLNETSDTLSSDDDDLL